MTVPPAARIKLAVYLGEGGHKLGPGKVALLEQIERHGSISAAARAMGMAYRHAWELVDDLNACFADPVVAVAIGGRRGGGAGLTDWGRELVACFRKMETATDRAIGRDVARLSAHAGARRVRRAEPALARRRSGNR